MGMCALSWGVWDARIPWRKIKREDSAMYTKRCRWCDSWYCNGKECASPSGMFGPNWDRMCETAIQVHPSDGYSYASSARFPKSPETVCFHADWCARYRFVGYAMFDGMQHRTYRRQGDAPISDVTGEKGPKYLHQAWIYTEKHTTGV